MDVEKVLSEMLAKGMAMTDDEKEQGIVLKGSRALIAALREMARQEREANKGLDASAGVEFKKAADEIERAK